MAFHQRLQHAWAQSGSMLCVGLDPDPARFPAVVRGSVFDFCAAIIDATADLVCAFKPQIAYFSAIGAERDLERVIEYLRDRHPDVFVLLDAKRGDIGPTAEQYAREAFDRYGADAVTVNPYLGGDTIEPYLRHPHGGVFVLCRTSNPGSGDFQSLNVDGEPLYQRVARRVRDWNAVGDCGLVVGATYPDELRQVRDIVGDLPILVPGVGAQGGDIEATMAAGRDSTGHGLAISTSRAVLYASAGTDFADAARAEALATHRAIHESSRT